MVEHKVIFKDFILDDQDSDRELTTEERVNILSKKIEAIKESSTWTGDLELSGISIMLNININIYIKSAFAYKRYWKFEVEHPEEEIDLVYADANHYNLLYKINTIFKLEKESEKNNINIKEILQDKIIKKSYIKNINELNNHNIEKFNNDIYFNEDSDIDISNNNI